MSKFLWSLGLGLGLAIGGGVVYGLVVSEAIRLVVVGGGGFLLAAVTILGTALAVNRQWIRSVQGGKVGKVENNYRLPEQSQSQGPGQTWGGESEWRYEFPAAPALPAGNQDDEVVA